jgi:hypothetical protein
MASGQAKVGPADRQLLGRLVDLGDVLPNLGQDLLVAAAGCQELTLARMSRIRIIRQEWVLGPICLWLEALGL